MAKLKNFLLHPVLILVFRLIIGVTFIYASYYKVMDPHLFAKSIYNYKIVPVAMINMLALVMPWLELFCGLMLIVGIFMRENALILALMLLVFSVAIVSVMVRGIDVECGCYRNSGVESFQTTSHTKENDEKVFTDKADYQLLIRDLIMILMALAIYYSKSSAFELEYYFSPRNVSSRAECLA